MSSPLVTLGMPTYNGAWIIKRALDSLAAQTWPNIEIVICDDVSSDATSEICRAFAERHPPAKFYQNDKNIGSWANAVKTASTGKGKYFAWVCPDDYWHPDFVTDLVKNLEREPSAVGAISACEYFWEPKSGRQAFVGRLREPYWPQKHGRLLNAYNLFWNRGSVIGSKSTMLGLFIHGLVRRDVFMDSIRCFNGKVEQEREAVLLWAFAGKLLYIDRPLIYKYRPQKFPRPSDLKQMAEMLDKDAFRAYIQQCSRKQNRRHSHNWVRAIRIARACLRSSVLSTGMKIVGATAVILYVPLRAISRILMRPFR